MIKLVLANGKGSTNITELVTNINWSGEYTQAARTLDFNMLVSPYDKNLPKVNIDLGDMIIFYVDNKEVFRGYIFTKEKSYSGNISSFTAYDIAIYTLKNEGSYNFKNVTAEAATRRVFNEFGIPIGSIEATNISINKKFISVNLYNIIMSCYTIASQNNGIKYMIQAKQGNLNVVRKGDIVLSISFENGRNLLDTTYSESVEKMVNNVMIVNKDGEKIKDITDKDLLDKYGSFQRVITQADDKDETKKAQDMLNGVDSKIRISGLGDITCITGMGVKVYDSYTGIKGLFYIDSDKHTWSNGEYTVDLVLNFKNLMDESERGDDNYE